MFARAMLCVSTHVSTCVLVSLYVHVRKYACVCTACIYEYSCMYVCKYIFMYVCKYGVPQGSNLLPFLFLEYISDLAIVSPTLIFTPIADDTVFNTHSSWQ